METISEFANLGLALLLAIGDWIAIARCWRIANYILKPAVMIAILAWLGLSGGFSGWMIWFSVGILFSLAGDVLLMLPRERFIAGLVAFLLAHLVYIVGFNQTLPPLNLSSLIIAGLAIFTELALYRLIVARLRLAGRDNLLIPVTIYSFVLSLMTVSALLTLTNPAWQPLPAILVSAGAILFMLSDTSLALNHLCGPEAHSRVSGLAAYQIGQILIVLGAWMHYQ